MKRKRSIAKEIFDMHLFWKEQVCIKVSGSDSIGLQAELLTLLNHDRVKWVTSLFNRVYNSGIIPPGWLMSKLILLPKKPGIETCSGYSTIICLMCKFTVIPSQQNYDC